MKFAGKIQNNTSDSQKNVFWICPKIELRAPQNCSGIRAEEGFPRGPGRPKKLRKNIQKFALKYSEVYSGKIRNILRKIPGRTIF